MSRIIGIDFGETDSVVAIMDRGSADIVPNAEGGRTTPSVAFFSDGEIKVGEIAKRQAVTKPNQTVRSIKRYIGDNEWRFRADGKYYLPQEIAAHIFMKLKRDTEAFLNEEVTRAVIAVPAYFNQAQRQAVLEAGQIAGLKVERLVPEPTAVALAYGIDEEVEQSVLVVNLEVGNYEVSVLEAKEGVFEVCSTSGDTHLGGDDWDQAVVDWMVEKFRGQNGIDLSADLMVLQQLRDAAEKAKIELCNLEMTEINLPFISASADGPLHLEFVLTRAEFNRITADLLARCREPLLRAMEDSELRPTEIDHVVLSGSATRMPAFRELVTEVTGQEIKHGINPDEAIAMGAAMQAGIINQDLSGLVLLDVLPLSIGIETTGGIMRRIIDRNTPYPTSNTETIVTTEDNQRQMMFELYQGEREMAEDNILLDSIRITGLPPGPKGSVSVDLTIDIDTNGIIHMVAVEHRTGHVVQQEVIPKSLPKYQVEEMIAEADAHREEELLRRYRIEEGHGEQGTTQDPDYSESSKPLTLDQQVAQAQQWVMDASKKAREDPTLRGKVPSLYRTLADFTESIEGVREQQEAAQKIQEVLTRLLFEFDVGE